MALFQSQENVRLGPDLLTLNICRTAFRLKINLTLFFISFYSFYFVQKIISLKCTSKVNLSYDLSKDRSSDENSKMEVDTNCTGIAFFDRTCDSSLL